MMQRLFYGVLVGLWILLSVGCSQQHGGRHVQQNRDREQHIMVGVPKPLASIQGITRPWNHFNVDIMQAIAKKEHLSIRFKWMPMARIIPSIHVGLLQIGMVRATANSTYGRSGRVSQPPPYHRVSSVFMRHHDRIVVSMAYPDLFYKVQVGLNAIKRDGTYQKIYKHYFHPNSKDLA